jgi:hypothetical protein
VVFLLRSISMSCYGARRVVNSCAVSGSIYFFRSAAGPVPSRHPPRCHQAVASGDAQGQALAAGRLVNRRDTLGIRG